MSSSTTSDRRGGPFVRTPYGYLGLFTSAWKPQVFWHRFRNAPSIPRRIIRKRQQFKGCVEISTATYPFSLINRTLPIRATATLIIGVWSCFGRQCQIPTEPQPNPSVFLVEKRLWTLARVFRENPRKTAVLSTAARRWADGRRGRRTAVSALG
jgi:hypothetical protein